MAVNDQTIEVDEAVDEELAELVERLLYSHNHSQTPEQYHSTDEMVQIDEMDNEIHISEVGDEDEMVVDEEEYG